jgi:hypothetical protein
MFLAWFQAQTAADNVAWFKFVVVLEEGGIVSDDAGLAPQKIISLKRWW